MRREKVGEKCGVLDPTHQLGTPASGQKWWGGSLCTIMTLGQQIDMAGCDIREQRGSDDSSDSTLSSPVGSGQIDFPLVPVQGSDGS